VEILNVSCRFPVCLSRMEVLPESQAQDPTWMVSIGLASLGTLILFIASIMLLVQAFRVNIWWGLLIFVPVLGVLIFSFANWGMAKSGFLLHMVGLVVGGAGIVTILGKVGWMDAEAEPGEVQSAVEERSLDLHAGDLVLPRNLTWA